MYSICMPNVLALMFHENTAARTRGMTLIRTLYTAVVKAEALLKAAPANQLTGLRKLMSDMSWQDLQLVREAFAVCRDGNWDYDDAETRNLAYALYGGPANTKFTLEEVFNHLKDITIRSNKGSHVMNKPCS